MAVKIDKKIKGYAVVKPEDKAAETAPVAVVAGPATAEIIHMHEKVERPEALVGATYKIKSPLVEHAMYVTINDIVLNQGTESELRRPFEVFINSKNMEHFAWTVALTRMISAVFRRGVVVGIESFEEYAGRGDERIAIGMVRKIKLADRVKHIELIGKHVDVQAWREQKALTGPNGEPLTLATVDLSKATPEQLRALAALKLSDAAG